MEGPRSADDYGDDLDVGLIHACGVHEKLLSERFIQCMYVFNNCMHVGVRRVFALYKLEY